MLEFELTPHHAGLSLWGDRAALERLHGFVHRVVAESEVIVDKEGFVLGLAYDVRKAFEVQRSVGTRSQFNGEHCRIYGVEILWPVILVQMAPMNRVQFPTENATGTEGVIGSLQAMMATRAAEA